MNDDAGSLQALRDIVEPLPPPAWPPAPGAWILLLVAVCLALAGFQAWRRARARDAYRRAGLALLAEARTARDVNVVLKRVALAAFPRPRVAPLYGDDWAAFLEATCPGTRFDGPARTGPRDGASPELLGQAEAWIRGHRVIPAPPAGEDGP